MAEEVWTSDISCHDGTGRWTIKKKVGRSLVYIIPLFQLWSGIVCVCCQSIYFDFIVLIRFSVSASMEEISKIQEAKNKDLGSQVCNNDISIFFLIEILMSNWIWILYYFGSFSFLSANYYILLKRLVTKIHTHYTVFFLLLLDNR